ncbi:hypothetical protein L226DRAFT_564278 [Lentinus tigrinus ALCF2SS1-7]|uniref:uncharacterized protein n=1 Tax=Lentinus tigrinus ALCF2SS1-7 TaxID=1328758 RepID=UPI001165E223|nr:hypothetical protein L226DRAFT_564278 [Lentinus tigrinus ALCF2SS1-7]
MSLSSLLWLPQVLAAPVNDPSATSSGSLAQIRATDIVSPSPPVQAPNTTHLTTYGILGIVISGVLVATAAIGYALRYWKRYKRSQLPPSAQYRESLRVAAREAAEATETVTAGQGGTAAGAGPNTREVAATGVLTSAAVVEGAKRSSQVKGQSAPPRRSASAGKGPGAGSSTSGRKESKSERSQARASCSKSESQIKSHTKSGSTGDSALRAGAGPGPSKQASKRQVTFAEIEEVPR